VIALRSIASIARAVRSASSLPLRSRLAHMRIAPSGERSSCDSIAMNWSFSRLASRSSRVRSSTIFSSSSACCPRNTCCSSTRRRRSRSSMARVNEPTM